MIKMIATASAVAFVVYSCGGKLKEAESLDLSQSPVQVVDSLFAVQTENGIVKTRIESVLMERYENDTMSTELFPKGFSVFGYRSEGLLETVIVADVAEHSMDKTINREVWKVYGNVVIQNVINQETVETDTLYWDRFARKLYTDCYVRMYSADGFMQGYGMESDESGANVTINKPFNTYVVVEKDTTMVVVDSVNFIGPFLKK